MTVFASPLLTSSHPSLASRALPSKTCREMIEWYYSSGGKQNGPVSFEQLGEIARSGGLNPLVDLVWTASMKDWLPAGQVAGIFQTPPAIKPPVADSLNPYAAPNSNWNQPARITEGDALGEIEPGSEPIDVGGCVKRAFDLTSRNFGMLLLVVIIYTAISVAVDFGMGQLDTALGWGGQQQKLETGRGSANWTYQEQGSGVNLIVCQMVGIFLSLGFTRISLNVVSGKPCEIGMLFGGGRLLLPALVATFLFYLMFAVGFVLLVVPGVYLALRYGLYLTAMVDRNLGIIASFKYSSAITVNNRGNLLKLWLLAVAIAMAGCLALCVGLLFALPWISLALSVAYRWLQYGHRAALDLPGTQTPMLTNH